MPRKEYAFYPGCSSQLRASAANYLTSTHSICKTLDIGMTPIPDWNCCGASISYAGGSELSRLVMNARNFALSETHLPGQDIVATCAACWLGAREAKHKLEADQQLLANANEALQEAGLNYSGKTKVRHMVEVLIEDFGYEALAKPVVKPLAGIKFAGYVGCQTNRPFGIAGESFENPKYLDRLIEAVGGEAAAGYEQKVTCCGGALAFSETEKSLKQIRDIVESAYDHGADMIVTPCALCQANVEVYQSEINKKYGTKLAMPVTYYSQLMAVSYGSNAKEAGLDGHIIQPAKLQEAANNPAPGKQ
ncbi:MAG: CoB--CoM heterodisulfide reductase iron-sulfur subunit B family protein [Nitrosomonadales bacterium]|nr:CoB--CoM heterodisulfide reductase iron-sulfur subunit B family protein [Nitrosomonadales bacterium]